MKASVTYKEDREDTAAKSIIFEAADMETVKKAVNQWRVNELRIKGRRLDIVSIIGIV